MKAWNYVIVYVTHSDLWERGSIFSQSRDSCPCKGNWPYSGLQRNTGHPVDMSRCADCHIVTDKWFCSASVKDMIPRQRVAGSLSASSIDQCPVLEEGQHWCWHGDPCIHYVLALWERSGISSRNLQKLGEQGTPVDCVGNTLTCCSEEDARCFPCLILGCECCLFGNWWSLEFPKTRSSFSACNWASWVSLCSVLTCNQVTLLCCLKTAAALMLSWQWKVTKWTK